MQPKVNIVLPVYNGASSIERLLKSILDQSYNDYRVMIIDNASTDGTEEICRSYCDRDSRFSYSRHSENLGFRTSYMRGYYASFDYEYMVYVSAGDFWHPEYLKECVRSLEDNPEAPLAYSYCQVVDSEGQITDQVIKDDFNLAEQNLKERYVTIISTLNLCTAFYGLIRMSVYRRYELLLMQACAAMDALMLAAFSLHGPFVEIKETLLFRELTMSVDEGYDDRLERLEAMNKTKIGFESMLYHQQIALHCQLVRSLDIDEKSKEELYFKTVKMLSDRYVIVMAQEQSAMIKTVLEGKIHGAGDDKVFPPPPPGQNQFSDVIRISKALLTLERFQWILTGQVQSGWHYMKSLLYLWSHRREEALLSLNKELAVNPTHRLSLELKEKLGQYLKEK